MKYKWILPVLILLGITSVTGRADTAFILNFTVNSSMFGFVEDEVYEWTLLANGDYDTGGTPFNWETYWYGSQSDPGTLLESLTGEGITGTFAPGTQYFTLVEAYPGGNFVTSAQAFNGGNFGFTPDNTPIANFFFGIDTAFAFPLASLSPFPDVDDYFSTYYNLTGTGATTYGTINSVTNLLTMNSVTIVSVPEPGTWALLGVGAIFLTLHHLRRKAARA